MIHHQSEPFGPPFTPQLEASPLLEAPPLRESSSDAIAMIAYRSRAVHPQSHPELARLLAGAQRRNRLEAITGLLIYDDGQFFQWLEGPRAALMQVWDAIRGDPRHCDIEILREQPLPTRFFPRWDMRLSHRTRGDLESVLIGAAAAPDVLRRLRLRPTVLVDVVWEEVFAEWVLPQMRLNHPGCRPAGTRRAAPRPAVAAHGRATIWHADPETGTVLARLSLAVNATDTTRFLDDLVAEGAALEPLFHEVFEPAARCLGRWCDEDLCDEFSVTAALGRLQVEAHRLSTSLNRAQRPLQRERTVLVAPQPGESHLLGASLSSELFWRDGWNVSCEFPGSDRALRELVHENWFDILELSSSDAHCRDRRLDAMRTSIRAAHTASKNPALAIIVDGRSFHERPLAYLDVGADCGCATSIEAVPAAQRLLAALAAKKDPGQGAALHASPDATLCEQRFVTTVF